METMLDRHGPITDREAVTKGRKLTMLIIAAIGLLSAASAAVAAPLPAEGAFMRTPAPAQLVIAFDGSRPKRKPQVQALSQGDSFAEHRREMPIPGRENDSSLRSAFPLVLTAPQRSAAGGAAFARDLTQTVSGGRFWTIAIRF